MSRIDVISAFAGYEMRRAIARRKVLILVAFTILLGTTPYFALSRAGSNIVPAPDHPYIWVVGIFLTGSLFLNFTAILIAAGAMSEEYEQGTAELLLSKPVNRSDYFVGKFLGGYLLFLGILAIDVFLSVASAYSTFGVQLDLGLIPGFFLTQAFSSLLFYSLAFMLGELLRRSSLAYIFSSALFLSSFLISGFLDFIYILTNNAFYRTIEIYLPTSPADSLPQQYVIPRLPSTISFVLRLAGSAVVPTIQLSIALILVYMIIGLLIAAVYFSYADISRRVS
ncbi:MAG: ABC transporter permease [archaeon]|nr:ABC transporter permease [archaeon]